MNGSTNGVVGFNQEQINSFLRTLQIDCNGITMLIEDIKESILGFCFAEDCSNFFSAKVIDFSNKCGGWYSPEAVTYDTQVLTPKLEQLNEITREEFLSLYNNVVDAANLWAKATGSPVSVKRTLGKLGYSFADELEYHAKATDKNGNIYIDPALRDVLLKEKITRITDLTETLNSNIKYIYKSSTFLGGEQQAMLNRKYIYLKNKIIDTATELYDTAIMKINECIIKYESMAQQIASSFNN